MSMESVASLEPNWFDGAGFFSSSNQVQLSHPHLHSPRRRLHRSSNSWHDWTFRHTVQLLPERHQEQERLLPPPVRAPFQSGARSRAAATAALQLPPDSVPLFRQRHPDCPGQTLWNRPQRGPEVSQRSNCWKVSTIFLSSGYVSPSK